MMDMLMDIGDCEITTEIARHIVIELIPIWIGLFLKKNASYGDAHALLGAKGCFPDLNRKVHQLKRALWDEESTDSWSEQPAEILLDLIGHAFMILSLISGHKTAALPKDPMVVHRSEEDIRSAIGDGGWDALPSEVRILIREMPRG